MKGKTRVEKGITLIALIITIVVLLILAAVAISSITNDGILSYATNAAQNYNQAIKNEQDTLNEYIGHLKGIGKAVVGTKVKKISTINGQPYTAYNPVIPEGFMPINTVTSTWENTNLEEEVKKGLVISDGTSEFVWIPVPILDDFARLQDGSTENYRGVLYDWNTDVTGATEYVWLSDGTNCREPANLLNSYQDNITNLPIWTENLYQNKFNKMVESVIKYKGFYVGRYEMSLGANGIAQSVAGVTSATASELSTNKWFGLYEKSLTYANETNMKLGVISEMIWGCQWDAMLRWMKSNNIDVTSVSPIDTARGEVASKNTTRVTGATGSNDVLNNIYDILGNSYECTQEAFDTAFRVRRGGATANAYPPSCRVQDGPEVAAGFYCSRLSLYVKV